MRWILLAAAVVLAVTLPVRAQTARVVAVADFDTISADSGRIPPAQLTALLAHLLAQQGAHLRVVAADAVRAALRARGYAPSDLVSPAVAAEVARAVGADWVVTGRWTQLRVVSFSVPDDPATPAVRDGDGLAVADVQVRVLEAASRQRVFEGRFQGVVGGADYGSLLLAASEALRGAAAAIARL
ncbi:MAG: hypothetical protein QN141_03155 [Armatimonadota bacterium]|nr:hypothetical protein [Armatimonadota bacterium]MDR7452047.1 hypothetical protein [Armatimonadota bacterium]MDR7466509.1 hypothetical protein [Armatimonadota bacterium]MDR7493231.1 hypothetical protein [Armatimonadota bacterium]MDR7499416.1 hypothetical protein [Armatimonadota bacterium]